MRNSAMLLIGVDSKCDALAEGEPVNLSYRKWMVSSRPSTRLVDAALRAWGVSR